MGKSRLSKQPHGAPVLQTSYKIEFVGYGWAVVDHGWAGCGSWLGVVDHGWAGCGSWLGRGGSWLGWLWAVVGEGWIMAGLVVGNSETHNAEYEQERLSLSSEFDVV